ncbi:uncharacterized protein JCM6883_001039 [Sporobolomyces salmoneus]|uniref:uncharacterized protein n=1 Tax=Sporobolomyces salmoneus TaxID=183962 RepID=UPI00317F00C4
MSSTQSLHSEDKKLESGVTTSVLAVVENDGKLYSIAEKDQDEGMKLAGAERQIFTQEESDAVKRKLDKRILPLLAAVYFSQFLDKNSLNYSSVMGLPIKGEHYNLVSMAFYLGFLVFELPTGWIGQHFPLAKYLAINVLLWATFLILHAASANFGFFFAMRFLLGCCEACVSPILIALISGFYRKDEQAKRIGAFYVQNGFTQIIGSLISVGVLEYKGDSVAHWRIIYFILGGMAFIVGFSTLFWLPDSPATANFLTEREKLIALERVRDNQTGTRNKTFKWYQAREAVTDLKTWALVFLVMLSCIPNGGLASFNSILIKGFGYSSRDALLLNLPEGAFLAITICVCCWWADKSSRRMMPMLGALVPTVFGLSLVVGFASPGNKAALVVGICFTQCYGAVLCLMYALSASSIAGNTKKSVFNAIFLSSFALSNLVGTTIFRQETAPQYLPGKIVVLVLFAAAIPTVIAFNYYILWLNKKKDERLQELIKENGWTPEDVEREAAKAAFADLTDKENPFMRYIN